MLDTGADYTHVDIGMAAQNGFTHLGTAPAHTASAIGVPTPVFGAQLELTELSAQPFLAQVWGFTAAPDVVRPYTEPFVGLIGRDILDLGLLVYNGIDGRFILELL